MSLKDKKLGIIGTGKMGSALIKGICDSGIISSSDIYASDVYEVGLVCLPRAGANSVQFLIIVLFTIKRAISGTTDAETLRKAHKKTP